MTAIEQTREHTTGEQATSSPPVAEEELWWRSPFRMYQTNLREIDADLDVDTVLEHIIDFGANAWLLNVGGIISNYPTRLPFQTPNPALIARPSGDLLGDAVTAAHARGVRVMARMDFSKVARPIAEAHPDWLYVGPDGRRQEVHGLTSVCPSGAYYQRHLTEVLEEVLAHAPVDGFFINWMSFGEVDYAKQYRGVCQCMACQRGFTLAHPDLTLPTDRESASYPAWRRWATAVIDDLLARARAVIAARRPEAPLVMGNTADIVFHEANNAIGRAMWHHQTSESVSAAKTYRPHVPVLVNSVAFYDMPYRLVAEEPHVLAQYQLQAIARGANPSTYVMGYPERLSYASLPAASQIVRFHRDHARVYDRLVPSARTALVRPDPLTVPEEGTDPVEEFRGLYESLLQRHIPFDVLPGQHLGELGSSLQRYALLVLGDLGALPAAAVSALERFTSRGGRLLLTGSTALAADTSQLSATGVARRTAVLTGAEATWSSVVVPDGGAPVPVLGAFHVLQAAEHTPTAHRVLSRAPYGPPEKCYGHLDLDMPATIRAGAVTTLPMTPGRAYRTSGLSTLRDLVADETLRLLSADVEIVTNLPEQVEVVVGSSRSGCVVHLRNLTGTTRQSFHAPLPIMDRTIAYTRWLPGQRLRALVTDTELVAEPASGAGAQVHLPDLGLFEVLVEA
ncbi:alpha-amylase family protein [Kineococcus arenarius]|uniref:alpha-amylase family protein n=1 Tax=Kineococcus sp. SYSU DK007 TaxID=3383128 RepID=UPI003D7C708D